MALTCKQCGSDKVIPGVALLDAYGDGGLWRKPQEVRVEANPAAWFFTGTETGSLMVRVCGDCGHAELYVTNHRALYDAYLRSQGDEAAS